MTLGADPTLAAGIGWLLSLATSQRKLLYLRVRPQLTVVFRSGWDWVAVEGEAELAGPDDPLAGVEGDSLARLLQETYAAAVGGDPDDWGDLDGEMADERHTAVLVRPLCCYSSAP